MSDNKELAGKAAVVTGAGRNIGRAIALALADGGASVVINVRSNKDEADKVVGEIKAAGRPRPRRNRVAAIRECMKGPPFGPFFLSAGGVR